mgnify:CR=1 FL=1
MNRILLLEDDVSLIDGLVYSLKKNEFDVEVSRTVCEAKQYLSELDRYDLLILDVTLPDGTGFDVCERVRKENQQIPIIFLTASDEEVSIIRGLDSGGDDYITKPFKLGELCSRIRALLRRAGVSKSEKNTSMECGDITIDLLGSRATLKGKALDLTSAEYRLLCLLVRNANRVVTRDIILNELWDDISPDHSLSVDSGILEALKEHPAVKATYGRMFAYGLPMEGAVEPKKADLLTYEENQFGWAKEYLLEGSLDTAANQPGTALIVYEPETTIQVGDTVTLDIGGKNQQLQIAGMLSTAPFGNANDTALLICSEDTFRQLNGTSNYTIVDIQLTNKATDEDVNSIQQIAGTSYTFSDERMSNSSVRGTYYCFCLFIYGFLVLIALITVFNIINSITMSVAARTRQYGVFRAIGLSTRQLKKMIIAEACVYTITGSLIGTVLGLICNQKLFEMLVTFSWGDAWTIPWMELTVILFVVILAVVFAVHRPVQKIQKISIVDTISAQ